MTTGHVKPCERCAGKGTVPRERRRMADGTVDPTDYVVWPEVLCDLCGGTGERPYKPEEVPSAYTDFTAFLAYWRERINAPSARSRLYVNAGAREKNAALPKSRGSPSELLSAQQAWAQARGGWRLRRVNQLGRYLSQSGIPFRVVQYREFGRRRMYEGIRLKSAAS